jgi:hypothetical protein
MHDLQLAELLVQARGDENWFREQYQILRETCSVADSIRGALDAQGLLGLYNSIKNGA